MIDRAPVRLARLSWLLLSDMPLLGAISVHQSLRRPAPGRLPPLTLPVFVIMLVN
jgi:hypothetical protein